MANSSIPGILEKMTGKDKDYRYMATSDLLNELNKEGFKLDNDLELRLSNIVLQQLDDAAGDVSGLAVKCLAPLVKKIHEAQVLEMTDKLCDKLLNGKDQHRDIASIALKTIFSEVPTSSVAQSVLISVSPKLIGGITNPAMKTDIKCECLDILSDILHKFGNLMTSDHEVLLGALLPQLSSNQASVRKKTVSCIASLASSLSDDLLAKATIAVVRLLQNKGTKPEMTRTNIQMIGALSRAVGYRFGPHLGDTVPILIQYCMNASENDEELREYSLQALESFLLRCPRDIFSYCNEILQLTLEYLSYDPNFTDNMEEDTDDEIHDEDDDDDSANEYTDDEDVSWKVRRAAAKCLAALIVSRPEMLSNLYDEACPKLIDRFKEREENVKMDVFNTFIELLRQTGNVTKGQIDIDKLSPRWSLKQEVPKVVKSINRQLREKSIKTKIGAFSVLKELVVVLPDCLADHIGSLIPGIEKALCEKSSTSNLKIEALIFTRLVLASHSPAVFHPYIKAISAPVLSAVGERYYKVTAEALRVCGELVRVVRPNIKVSDFDFKPYVHPIYNAIMSRLTNQDQDQEVKECAISCMGLLVSTFGDHLTADLPACLPVLVDRMGNEITRLTAVKAKQHLALLCLGEIGRRKDLSSHAHIENIVIESFQSPFEEIKSAASYALGNIAVGNLPKYLPFILNQIDNQQKKQYLLLHSLKEVIVRQSVDKAEFQDSSVEKILNLLFNHCESEEEGVRNVVAECLGKIALIKPSKLVPALKERTTSPAAFTRATVVVAVKYSIVERPEKIDSVLYPEISSFLMLIKDQDRHVRRAAVLALSIAGHNKPNLIKSLLPELLPLLYDQTVIKKELIRTVDLGPFKHTVDDGLELRKAAFECVDTLLDNCLDQLNPSSFIVPYLKSGLDDHYDVKMPCHLILSKLADKCPSAVLAVLDSLVDPLQKTVNFKPKQDAVKQEVDRNEDMIRSALRAVASLNRISGGDCSHKFKNLMAEIAKSQSLWEKYCSIRNE
ncbi:cullin-associated NEDD8-dissociated protein 1 isoform X4 [Cynara cardunculus var. scolymus]|uniref:cullin-associated NEDD8-dissociated protein 1 isoform X4 n=1 Tax=Cynara cardunculus var. scolymus TaxID=59895 RepID=UPI000D623CB9|nr:cullin-associated NEDD8-dissociated protein 1 isoform X4 [Cynara cardunculus var. scolymus]